MAEQDLVVEELVGRAPLLRQPGEVLVPHRPGEEPEEVIDRPSDIEPEHTRRPRQHLDATKRRLGADGHTDGDAVGRGHPGRVQTEVVSYEKEVVSYELSVIRGPSYADGHRQPG